MAASGCVNSKETLKVAAGDGSPCRQAVTLSKPGGRATTCVISGGSDKGESLLASPTCNHPSGLLHWALLASELQWQCLYFVSPQATGTCPNVVASQKGCNTFSQPSNNLGGASIFTHFWHGIQGSVDSLGGLPTGVATFSSGMSEGSVGHLWKWRYDSQRTTLVGPHCQKWHHQKMECPAPSSSVAPGQTLPKGIVSPA